MINQQDISKTMTKDIDEMERMLNDYLQFAKTQSIEETQSIQISKLFYDIKDSINNQNLIYLNSDNVIIKGRLLALKRCFEKKMAYIRR